LYSILSCTCCYKANIPFKYYDYYHDIKKDYIKKNKKNTIILYFNLFYYYSSYQNDYFNNLYFRTFNQDYVNQIYQFFKKYNPIFIIYQSDNISNYYYRMSEENQRELNINNNFIKPSNIYEFIKEITPKNKK